MSKTGQPKGLPTYHLEWAIAVVIAATGLIVGLEVFSPKSGRIAPLTLPGQDRVEYADWYTVVRLPEMPVEAASAEVGVRRLADWMQEMMAAGFHPRPFAEVMETIAQGGRVPERTVVLVFEPAYRTTVDQVLPVLEELQVPALWITDAPGTVRSDRRFVSNHKRRALSATDIWDFALRHGDERFEVESDGLPAGLPTTYHWKASLGVTGLNPAIAGGALNRLHANAQWSAADFVNRLRADLPLRRRSGLSVRLIDGRNWGILADAGETDRFDLSADPDRRFASTTWSGTGGVNDLSVDLEIGSWFGEAWLFLRSSPDRTERIRVGLTGEGIRVLQETAGKVVADQREPVAMDPAAGVRLSLVLDRDTLRISAADGGFEVNVPVAIRGSTESVVEFALYHRIHGAAHARDVALTATPMAVESGSVGPVTRREPASKVSNLAPEPAIIAPPTSVFGKP